MFARVLVFGTFLRCIGFSSADGIFADAFSTDGVSADGGFTDGLSWFNNENIDPLQITYSLDPTRSDLVSGNLDGFDTFLNDPGSDFFASSVDSINDPTLVADCTSNNNDDYLGKRKARLRRQTTCRDPASDFNPNLSLPTLDQVFPTDNEDPEPPKADRGKKMMNEIIVPGAWFLKLIDTVYENLTDCSHNRICSSNLQSDVLLESNGVTWTVRYGTNSKFVHFFVFCFSFFGLLSRIRSFCKLFSSLSLLRT